MKHVVEKVSFQTAACSSDPISPQHGSRLPTALLGAVFFGRSIPRDSVCWGWVTCSSCSVRRRSAEACGTARPASGRLTASSSSRAWIALSPTIAGNKLAPYSAHPFRITIDASRPQSRRRSRSDPLQAASGAACVRRGPQCTDSIALSCPSGLRWRRSGPGGSRNSGAGRRASWGFCVAASCRMAHAASRAARSQCRADGASEWLLAQL